MNEKSIRPAITSKWFGAILTILVASSLSGCGGKSDTQVSQAATESPPPRHWDVGDQTLKYPLPEDIADGYLQFARSTSMSFGLTLAHERISARSHSGSDMLIYVHDGVGRFKIGDKEVTASTGDLLFVPKGAVYSADAVSKRGLELLTMYAPPLDSNDLKFIEPTERVREPARLKPNPTKIDSMLRLAPEKDEDKFLKMNGYKEIQEGQ